MNATGKDTTDAGGPGFTGADQETIHGMFQATPGYLRGRDTATWSAQYLENAILHPPNASAVVGRDAMRAWADALPPIEEIEFFDIHVSGEGGLAWGTSRYRLKFAGLPPDTGKQLVVVRRDAEGRWKGVAVSFNSDLPIPGAGGGGT